MAELLPSFEIPTSLQIGTDCIICEQAEIKGNVTIGSSTIIHPKARIIAEAGPIIIGEGNLIEEKAVIWNRAADNASGVTPVMIIGSMNVFEVFSHCEALKVGDRNTFEPKSFVDREVVVTDGCVVGAGCSLTGSEVLEKQTSVFGSKCCRTQSAVISSHASQMETLAKTLPLHNSIKKLPKAPIK